MGKLESDLLSKIMRLIGVEKDPDSLEYLAEMADQLAGSEKFGDQVAYAEMMHRKETSGRPGFAERATEAPFPAPGRQESIAREQSQGVPPSSNYPAYLKAETGELEDTLYDQMELAERLDIPEPPDRSGPVRALPQDYPGFKKVKLRGSTGMDELNQQRAIRADRAALFPKMVRDPEEIAEWNSEEYQIAQDLWDYLGDGDNAIESLGFSVDDLEKYEALLRKYPRRSDGQTYPE
mgnify:CR=1 FL=1